MVICCAECERELTNTKNGGLYCEGCKYAPSVQDTFLWEREKYEKFWRKYDH